MPGPYPREFREDVQVEGLRIRFMRIRVGRQGPSLAVVPSGFSRRGRPDHNVRPVRFACRVGGIALGDPQSEPVRRLLSRPATQGEEQGGGRSPLLAG